MSLLMINETPTVKQTKTLKVRRKILIEKVSPRTKVYKIAKKIDPDALKSPIPNSIQDDFFSFSEHPDQFLSHNSCKSNFELISPVPPLRTENILTPTNIVGPKDLYYKKANIFKPQTARSPHRNTLKLDKTRFTMPKLMGFDERLRVIRDAMKTSRDQEEREVLKLTPGGKITWLSQTKSLKAYEKQRDYWKKIEGYLAEKVQKNPEDLGLNSAKAFEVRKKEIEVIDKVQKMNEVRSQKFWYDELRAGLYSQPQPPLVLTSDEMNTLQSKKIYQERVLMSTKKEKEIDGLRNTDYFRKKVQEFKKGKAEIKHFCFENLEVYGKGKLKMELNAVKRTGIRTCLMKDNEDGAEDIIEVNYSPKTIY
jgi:hypothetical protein